MPDDERDYWQEYKDGVATGLLNEDGSQREPDEPDWDRGWNEALAAHEDAVHGGLPCNCPLPLADAMRLHEDQAHDGLPCDCSDEPPF